VARADLTPPVDPEIAIDIGSDSTAIGPGVPFYSDTTLNGGGVTYFYNPNSGFITQLAFLVQVQTGLSQSQFSCFNDGSDGTFGGFFLNCSPVYDSGSGLLTLTFFGTSAAHVEGGCDTEVGEHEGIPPLQAGCTGQGQFGVDLNNVVDGVHQTTGSWNSVSPNQDFSLTFDTTGVQVNGADVVPEPSTMLPLAGACLLIAIFARRRLLHRTTALRS
jgi:hypothetical protein